MPFTCDIAMVINVEVEVVSAGLVRVSWNALDIPEITGYIVYYSQTGNTQSVNVTSSANSVLIDGLINNVEYQFQVAAIAELNGDVAIGERSLGNTVSFSCSPVQPQDSNDSLKG